METDMMPAAFLGHGSPMNALDHNGYTEAWRAFGSSLPRPRAILAVSAHWYINASAVTAMDRPKTIHDFYGFPDALFAVRYPAPGDPDLAAEITEIVKPTWVGLDRDSWGIDHGTWSVLVHAFPDAAVPVLQLSINAEKPFDYHFELGAKLAPLRAQGVVIIASGNVVHNLGLTDPRQTETGFDWAQRFNEEHFIPLLYLAGLAEAAGSTTDVLVDGYTYGSLSMAAYTLGGASRPARTTSPASAAPLPSPDIVPPDDTNA